MQQAQTNEMKLSQAPAPVWENPVRPSLPAQTSREWAPADGPSGSTPERFARITTPSGFQTRYIVKSFNCFVVGKLVFSQTTYIPLGRDFPLIPGIAPVPTSRHEAQPEEPLYGW